MKRRKTQYHPWDKWFRKNTFTLKRKIDYYCQPHSMAVQVRTAAAKRSLECRVEIDEGTITVTIYR